MSKIISRPAFALVVGFITISISGWYTIFNFSGPEKAFWQPYLPVTTLILGICKFFISIHKTKVLNNKPTNWIVLSSILLLLGSFFGKVLFIFSAPIHVILIPILFMVIGFVGLIQGMLELKKSILPPSILEEVGMVLILLGWVIQQPFPRTIGNIFPSISILIGLSSLIYGIRLWKRSIRPNWSHLKFLVSGNLLLFIGVGILIYLLMIFFVFPIDGGTGIASWIIPMIIGGSGLLLINKGLEVGETDWDLQFNT